MIRPVAAAILVMGVLWAVPAGAQDGWWLIEAVGPDETRYDCGGQCPDSQLICVHSASPVPSPVSLEMLLDPNLTPWAQMQYGFAQLLFLGRGELGADGAQKGPTPPERLVARDMAWVFMGYEHPMAGRTLEGRLLVWPGEEAVHALACSAFAPSSDDAQTLMFDLAVSLRQEGP